MDNVNALVPRRTTTILAALWLTARSANAIQPHSSDWATQGFYFDWNSPSTVLPTPITAQCETLNVHWNRAAGTGPDPIPPFFLKIHSSAVNSTTDSFQFVDAGSTSSTQLTIPFPPGTLYIICMTDSMGVSGGCQDLYTVYPSTTNQTCNSFTAPAQVLGMKATSLATNSAFSRWGWPASCTDLELEPVDDGNGGIKGTPPYTLTVAPAIRPPLNITFEQSVKWTITVDHGTPFFLSVSDANGVTWTDGPLHAGAGDKSCLLQSTSPQPGLSVPITIGAVVGSFFLGGVLALIAFWLFVRRHRSQGPSYQLDTPRSSPSNLKAPRTGGSTFSPLAVNGYITEPGGTHPYTAVPNPAVAVTTDSRGGKKRPDNYGPLGSHDSSISVLPALGRQRTPDGHTSTPESSVPLQTAHRNSSSSHLSASSPTGSNPPPLTHGTSTTWDSSANPMASPPVPGVVPVHEVYVVHHDAGAPPPVTVYALPGSRVTELPPGYNFGSESSGGSGAARHSEPQLALVGEHPSPVSPTTPSFFRRDQKASYTPRSAPAPSTTFPPLSLTSPTNSTPDEQAYTKRLLPSTPTAPTVQIAKPSTPQMPPSTPVIQTPTSDRPASATSRTRGPRPMSPPR